MDIIRLVLYIRMRTLNITISLSSFWHPIGCQHAMRLCNASWGEEIECSIRWHTFTTNNIQTADSTRFPYTRAIASVQETTLFWRWKPLGSWTGNLPYLNISCNWAFVDVRGPRNEDESKGDENDENFRELYHSKRICHYMEKNIGCNDLLDEFSTDQNLGYHKKID